MATAGMRSPTARRTPIELEARKLRRRVRSADTVSFAADVSCLMLPLSDRNPREEGVRAPATGVGTNGPHFPCSTLAGKDGGLTGGIFAGVACVQIVVKLERRVAARFHLFECLRRGHEVDSFLDPHGVVGVGSFPPSLPNWFTH